ncbi:MAG: Z1 domain-containing protein [Sodaliphilus sp.]|nr:Z1 domain-containing protein [Sodaliphilus sp.]
MDFLTTYISSLKFSDLKETVANTSSDIFSKIKNCFDNKNEATGLLLGNVQSGKTAQMLGIMSKLADEGYQFFIVLTTDNVDLQNQTYQRIKESLPLFNVFGEKDEVAFASSSQSKPRIIVLKKNSRVLRKWRNILLNADTCKGLSLVILDDEADAASLNTLVNRNRVSTINRCLQNIKNTADAGTLYLEVTATPQAIILQSTVSDWRPEFVTYFKPGNGYLGGNFFFSNPKSYCIKFTPETEISDILEEADSECPLGLRQSILSYLINCAHKLLNNETNCNFMIHPSSRISAHNRFADRVQSHLNLLKDSCEDEDFKEILKESWIDLQGTKPDLEPFDDIYNSVKDILENGYIRAIPLNSTSLVSRDPQDPNSLKLGEGFNIVVGGNTLGRGITFPHLQTVYYCRSSRTPQADTFWQHSRIFGYDREAELVRIYIPPTLHRLFVALNESNNLLIKQIENGVDNLQIISADGIRPTRKNVLDTSRIDICTGGVNMFPISPIENNTAYIDPIILQFANEESVEVDKEMLIDLLSKAGSVNTEDFDSNKYINSIKTLASKRPTTKFRLITRVNRNISRGTGTLLSEPDRILGDRFSNEVVLTMYRLNGLIDNGWNGSPLWVPNIKFPSGFCFYTVD